MPGTERGYLLIADISGYTRFLSGVELEHSQDLISNLLGVVIEESRGVMQLAKLEGDAVFCFETGAATSDAIVTLAQAVYFAFRRWRRDVEHLTTCRCEACRRIPDLDLKVLVHRGEFVLHQVAGSQELLGPDVILLHRLLKNTVTEHSGIAAYALFTDSALPSAIGVEEGGRFTNLVELVDDREVQVRILDLDRRWLDEAAEESVFVSSEGAVNVLTELPGPPAVIWDWMADPERRRRWNGADRIDSESPGGVRGAGTQTHCVHGRRVFDEEILDWKPHRYVTIRTTLPGGRAVFTIEFAAVGPDRSSIGVHIAPDATGPRRVFLRRVVLPKMRQTFSDGLERLAELIEEERSGAGHTR